MNPSSALLIKALRLDPTLSEPALIAALLRHLPEFEAITHYRIGDSSVIEVPPGARLKATVTNLFTPYLNVHGRLEAAGDAYRFATRLYFGSGANAAWVNDLPVEGGLVVALDHVSPDLLEKIAAQTGTVKAGRSNIDATATLAFIFHPTAGSPRIALYAKVDVGLFYYKARAPLSSL